MLVHLKSWLFHYHFLRSFPVLRSFSEIGSRAGRPGDGGKRIILLLALICSISHPMAKPTTVVAPVKAPAPAAQATLVKPPAAPIQTSTKEVVTVKTGPGPQPIVANAPQVQNFNQTSPVIVNVNNMINQTDNSQFTSNHNLTQKQIAAQQANQEANQNVEQTTTATLKNAIWGGAAQAQEQLVAFGEWIKTNKYKITAAGVCSCYVVLATYLIRASFRMHDEALWARWRIEDSYEQLMSTPQKQLAQDLVFAIQRRYTSEKQFTDFIQPLTTFLADLEQEKRLLKNYITAAKWITTTRLDYVLPINEKKIKLAKKLLRRLYFIEHVFLSWAAEFKIAQNLTT